MIFFLLQCSRTAEKILYIELSVCILFVSCIVAPNIFSYSWYSAVCVCINRYSLMITSSKTGKQPSEGNKKPSAVMTRTSPPSRKAFFFLPFNLFFLHFSPQTFPLLRAQERSACGPFLSRQGGGTREKFIESLWGEAPVTAQRTKGGILRGTQRGTCFYHVCVTSRAPRGSKKGGY